MDDYQLAVCAAKTVAGVVGYPVCDDDLADMIQEAYIGILETRGREEKYRLASGKIRARNWLTWWIYGATRDKIRGMRIKAPRNINGYERLNLGDDQMEGKDWVMEEKIEMVIRMVSKTGRKEEYIARDTQMLMLFANGFSTIGIAQEMGLSVHRVNCHRQFIRRRLERWMRQNGICICCGEN